MTERPVGCEDQVDLDPEPLGGDGPRGGRGEPARMTEEPMGRTLIDNRTTPQAPTSGTEPRLASTSKPRWLAATIEALSAHADSGVNGGSRWNPKRWRLKWLGSAGSTSAVTLEDMNTIATSEVSLHSRGMETSTVAGGASNTSIGDHPEERSEGTRSHEDDIGGRHVWETEDGDVRRPPQVPRGQAHMPSVKMAQFREHYESSAQLFMDRREAPPTQLAECAKCGGRIRDNPQGRHTLYRCIDCHQVGERCVDCIIASHEERPFDRIRMWNEDLGFWEKTNIAELGFVWSLGHGGTACPRNHSPSRAMVFLHEHGIMDLKVKFCACLNADSDAAQLIEHGCWPATWHTPHTAFSLTAMATFHGLELQATVNVHDYVKLLCRMTDGIAPDNVKDRYREFNSSMREYRQVRARRRGGVEMHATPKSGELAVLCPACPQPGINMRPGWRERKHPYRYIDALTYSIDGNFHLGSKAKETDEADVALSEGAGYFVNSKDFKTYLEKAPEPPAEPTTCNQFGAMGTGKYKGKISGVIAITCRHMFLLPGGIVDLQLGEKYRFVDFALVSAMQRYLSLRLLVGTYDIHCQYIRHLRKHLREQFGEVIEELDSIQSSELPAIVAGVGKYHLAMHKGECRHRHSLHYLPGSCMTDGEMLERIWAVMNTVARRTKEMSAGHRQDVLNDHYSDQNVRRVHSMVPELVEKLRVADEMAHVSTEYIQCVEKTINPHDLATWREAEEEWKEKVVDITQHNGLPNPYEPPQDATLTSQAILAQLQQERLAEGQSGPTADVNVVHTVMELRDESERLRAQVIAHNGSETERSRLALRLENYRERAAACREKYMSTIQVAVDSAMAEVVPKESSEAFPNRDDIDDLEKGIPVLASSKGKAVDGSSRTPPRRSRVIEEMLTILDEGTFRLPSDCHSAVREHKSMAPFTRLERALREGQANEALDVLRLHLTTHLALTVRKQEGAGVIHNTAADRRLQEKRDVIDKWKEKYRHLRLLLLVLGMSDDDNTYRRLNDDDCKAFTLLVSEQKLGDSFKKPTWIWGDFGWAEKLEQGEIREFVGHAMRAHWFRHNALRTRWEEEVNVRLEEMWRTLAFFEHMERTWLVRADVMASKGTALAGACVSARRQAHRWTRLRHRAEQAFPRTIDQRLGMPDKPARSALATTVHASEEVVRGAVNARTVVQAIGEK